MHKLTRVEELYGDLTTIRARVNECEKAANEIIELIHTRVITDKKNAERRAVELKKEVDSATCSDTVKRIKQREIEAIAERRYEPTDGEKAEFDQTIIEYKAALSNLKAKQSELKDASREAKRYIDDLNKKAYEGDALVVRLYESQGKEARAALKTGFAYQSAYETDLMEENGKPADPENLAFRPFEIKTVKFVL